MNINKEYVRKAINGDRDALFYAFIWDKTEQGYKYWANQYHGHAPIDVETLRKMIGEYEPKTWGEMTDAEKGALLLAQHDGKVIELYDDGEWDVIRNPKWFDMCEYRIRPEPVRKTVTIYSRWIEHGDWLQCHDSDDTHRITFDLIDGEPDFDSIKMERI